MKHSKNYQRATKWNRIEMARKRGDLINFVISANGRIKEEDLSPFEWDEVQLEIKRRKQDSKRKHLESKKPRKKRREQMVLEDASWLASLKVPNGRDEFSNLRLPELILQVEKEVAIQVAHTFEDTKCQAACLRWYLRGLLIKEAISKIKVDMEIADHLRGNRLS